MGHETRLSKLREHDTKQAIALFLPILPLAMRCPGSFLMAGPPFPYTVHCLEAMQYLPHGWQYQQTFLEMVSTQTKILLISYRELIGS